MDEDEQERAMKRKSEFLFIDTSISEEGKEWPAEWRSMSLCLFDLKVVKEHRIYEKPFDAILDEKQRPGDDPDLSEEERKKFVDFIQEDLSDYDWIANAPADEKKQERLQLHEARKFNFNKQFKRIDEASEYILGKVILHNRVAISELYDGQDPPRQAYGRYGTCRISPRDADAMSLLGFYEYQLANMVGDDIEDGDLRLELNVSEEYFRELISQFDQYAQPVLHVSSSVMAFQPPIEQNGFMREMDDYKNLFIGCGKYRALGHLVIEEILLTERSLVPDEPFPGYKVCRKPMPLDDEGSETFVTPISSQATSQFPTTLDLKIDSGQLKSVVMVLWIIVILLGLIAFK